MAVSGKTTPFAVALVGFALVAPFAHLFVEAQRGTNALEDHAKFDPGVVIVNLSQGEARAESPEIVKLVVSQ